MDANPIILPILKLLLIPIPPITTIIAEKAEPEPPVQLAPLDLPKAFKAPLEILVRLAPLALVLKEILGLKV
jgi:hypothetical protein